MPTIFRLGTEGATTHQGWTSVATYPYNSESRDSINDPNGASARHEITSIPSPLARIDIVKNAFAQVAAGGGPHDGTIFHQTVSHALDVGEIFFNISKYRRTVEIIKCDVADALRALAASEREEHRLLADALQKYITTDAPTYNFDTLRAIYLLNDTQGPDELNIIGATSPATLFMPGPDNAAYAAAHFAFGTHRPFTAECRPLAQRDPAYVKMWFALRNTIAHFADRYEEVNDYLKLTYRAIADPALRHELETATLADGLEPIDTLTGSMVEVGGHPLYQRKADAQLISSDFELRPTRAPQGDSGERLPLALPVNDDGGNIYAALRYTTDIWGTHNSAPISDPRPLGERTLPNDGSTCPYLTLGDLLEPCILRADYNWNSAAFHTGQVAWLPGSASQPRAYLLPLKPLFFKYFTPADTDRLLTISELAAGVKVTLRVPIRGKGPTTHVEYSRIYYNSPAAGEADGCVVNAQADGTPCNFQALIMPRVRFDNEHEALFTAACIGFAGTTPQMHFGAGGAIFADISPAPRHPAATEGTVADTYTIARHNVEYIAIELPGGRRSLAVPRMKPQGHGTPCHIAADIGTSNTHIEVRREGDTQSQPLSFGEGSAPATPFFRPATTEIKGRTVRLDSDLRRFDALRATDYLPPAMGGPQDGHAFPTPTALNASRLTDWTRHANPFELCNAGLDYFQPAPPDVQVITDIKWGGGARGESIFRAYAGSLALTLRNWLLENGADPKEATLTWFYPLSMTPHRRHGMERAWNDAWHQWFNPLTNTTAISESEAPTLFYYAAHAEAKDIVSIDIGGGTTDIAISEARQLKLATSFRFAANDIFQNGLALTTHNGIIDHYLEELADTFANADTVRSQYLRQGDMPATAATRLFALKDAPAAAAFTDEAKDFSRILAADEDFKIVFILFYAAIIFHLGRMLKLTGRPMPRHITFSGNGSKVLTVISPDPAELASLTKAILALQGVEGAESAKLDILGFGPHAEPKRATCMGALTLAATRLTASEAAQVAICADGNDFVPTSLTFSQVAADTQRLESIRQSVADFTHLALDLLDTRYSLTAHFGASRESLELARSVCRADSDVETYIARGIEVARDSADGNTNLTETLFFYPIKGLLNNLALAIREQIKRRPGC